MSDLYSYKGAFPYPLPKDMTSYDINDFVLAPNKPTLSPSEKLEWNGSEWVVRPSNEAETQIQWQAIRDRRNELLKQSDISLIKELEETGTISQSLKDYRSALRDLPQTASDPFNITFPTYTV